MSKILELRRGSTADHANFVGSHGEFTIDTTVWTGVVHDNATPGGHRLASETYVNQSFGNLTVSDTTINSTTVDSSIYINPNGTGAVHLTTANVRIGEADEIVFNVLPGSTVPGQNPFTRGLLSSNGSANVGLQLRSSQISSMFFNPVTGNIGINRFDPSHLLHVGGDISAERLFLSSVVSIGTQSNVGLYVNGIRNDTINRSTALYYNPTTKEVTYGPEVTIPIRDIQVGNGLDVNITNGVANITLTAGGGSSGAQVSVTPPVDPITGQLWYDTNTGRIYVYDLSAWIDASPPVSVGVSQSSGPPTAGVVPGQLWYDIEDGHLYVRYQNTWVDTTIAGSGGGTLWTNDANGCLRAELSSTGFEAFTDATHLDLQDSGQWTIGSYQYGTFIGNDEFTNVNILSLRSGDDTYITTNLRENGNHQWKFDTDGVLNFPNNNGQIGQLEPPYTGLEFRTGSGADWIGISYGEINDNNTSYFYFDKDGSDYTTADHRAHLQIKNPEHDGHVEWLFDSNGNLTFPQGTLLGYSELGGFIIDGAVDKDIAIYTYSGADAHGWTFGTDGSLTAPGNLVIAGNASLMGGNGALIQSADNLPLLALTSGTDGGIVSFWAEDVGDLLNSNIAAVYANPTSGSGIVRIAVGQNGGPGPNLWDFGTDGNLTLPAGGDIRDRTSNISRLKTRIGDTYASGAFHQLTLANEEGKLITISGGNSLFRLPQITANSLGAEFEFYFAGDSGQVYIQAFYTDNRATTDRFVGSVFVGVDNSTQGRLHTATAGVSDANYLFLGQHHAKAGSYIRFKAIAFDTDANIGTWLVQGQCVGDTVNTTPNGQSYIFQNYYD